MAVEISAIELPGNFKNQKSVDRLILGRISILYDALNDIVLDGFIRSFAQGEVILSSENLKHVSKGDFMTTDRVYQYIYISFSRNTAISVRLMRVKINHGERARLEIFD